MGQNPSTALTSEEEKGKESKSQAAPAPPATPAEPMGCAHSTEAAQEGVATPAAPSTDPVPAIGDSAAAGPGGVDSKKIDTISKQRRRLSVTPALVGDVEGNRINPTSDAAAAAAAASASPAAKPGGTSRRLSLGPVLSDEEVAKHEEVDLTGHLEEKSQSIANEHVAVTKKGFVPYNTQKTNQDAYFLRPKLCGRADWALFGVCDGHGEFGHHVSAFIRDKLPGIIEEAGEEKILADPPGVLKTSVEALTVRLSRTKINCTFSGSTLVFGMRLGSTLYVANVGDSRCVLAKESEGKVVGESLSWDQKPDVPEEKKRILEKGGRVHALSALPGEEPGPQRVWLKDVDVPGLAMSRSIGDLVSHTVGVIAVPEISKHEITAEDLFVVWASDGVWEFLSSQEAVEIVHKKLPDIEDATAELVLEAERKWKKFESVVDDITCVILFLRNVE